MATNDRELTENQKNEFLSWDFLENRLQKAQSEDERGIIQFSSFQVKMVKKYRRTVEPLVPDIVWEDPNLGPSLKRYFEYCTRDTELIFVRKPKVANTTDVKGAMREETEVSKISPQSQEPLCDDDELKELDRMLQSISCPEGHLLEVDSYPSSKSKAVSKSSEFGATPSISLKAGDKSTSLITIADIRPPTMSTSQAKPPKKQLIRSTSASSSSHGSVLIRRKEFSTLYLNRDKELTTKNAVLESKRPRASSDPEVSENDSTSFLNGATVSSTVESLAHTSKKKKADSVTTTTVIFPHATSDRMFLLLKCIGLSFDLQWEPFLCSIALYDLKERIKLSEDFYFIIKSQEFKVLDISQTVYWAHTKPITTSHNDDFNEFGEKKGRLFEALSPLQALFSAARGNFSVVFLLRIHRLVLTDGDEKDTPVSVYSKLIDPLDTKFQKLQEDMPKLLNSARELLWTPIGFSLIPVYHIGTSQIVTSHHQSNVPSPKVKEKELSSLLAEVYGKIFLETRHIDDASIFELVNNEDILKHKVIPGHFIYKLKEIENTDTLKYRIDSSLRFVAPKPPKDALSKVVKEIEDFSMMSLPAIDYTCNLYVYPLQTEVGKISNIKVQMQVKVDDNMNSKPLPIIYSRERCGFVDTISCMFLVNKTSPHHFDEIKVRLPPLTPRHHLLFTFLHVESLKKQVILGYVVVPLLHNGSIISDKQHTFVIIRDLPKNYLRETNEYFDKKTERIHLGAVIKEKKMYFTLRTRLISSFYVNDDVLKDFIDASEYYINSMIAVVNSTTTDNSPSRVTAIRRGLERLTVIQKESCVKWFPRIFNELMRLIVISQYDAAANDVVMMEAFVALITLIKRLREQTLINTEMLLTNYLNYIFEVSSLRLSSSEIGHKSDTSKQIKSEQNKTKKNSDQPKDKSKENKQNEKLKKQHTFLPFYACFVKAWLDVMELKDSAFAGFTSHWFLFDLLVKAIVLELYFCGSLDSQSRIGRFSNTFKGHIESLVLHYLQEKWVKMPQFASIIIAIGTFFNKLFKVMERGFVCAVLHRFLAVLNSLEKKFPKVAEDKWNLLKIVTRQNEDYIALNYPRKKLKLSNSFDITPASFRRHFLTTILIKELFDVAFAPLAVQKQAIQLFKNVLIEFERPYSSEKIKEQIANMYFPFVTKLPEVVDFISRDPNSAHEWLLCWFHLVKTCNSSLFIAWVKRETQRKTFLLFKFLSTALSILQDHHDIGEAYAKIRFITLTLLLKIMQVKCVDLADTSNLLLAECLNVLHSLLNIRQSPLDNATYHEFTRKNITTQLEMRKSPRKSAKNIAKLSPTEVAFLTVVFKCLKYVATKYKNVIFLENEGNAYLQLLSYGLLYYSSMSHSEISSLTSRFFFDLIQLDYKVRGSIQKIRSQSIIAMSKLVGDRKILSVKALEKSLNTIVLELGDATKQITAAPVPNQNQVNVSTAELGTVSSEYGAAVKELIQNLITVALYHDRINDSTNVYDPATLVDFYYNIAKGSSYSPDLRISWLLNIAKFQINMGNFVEAGMCYLHAASLLGQYLVNTKQLNPLTADEVIKLSSNIQREEPLQNVQNVDVSDFWSIEKYTEYLQLASNLFEKGQMYEFSISLYTTLCKIFAAQKNYIQLSQTAKLLDNVTTTLIQEEEERKRLYYNYYRVEFYGNAFGELHGKAFIYRQSETVKMLEFQEYLKSQFRNYSLTFLTVSDSELSKILNTKNARELCYVRVLFVEPHFTAEEMSERLTPFEKHTNINKFKVELPFTADGGSRAESLVSQYLKKVTYTVEATFPFVKNRLLVSEKQETILNPVENARWILIRQLQRLEEVMQLDPVHKSSLQQLLQGSVAPMVHGGPSEIANLFLNKENAHKFDPQDIRKLRRTMNEFLVVCETALKLHKSIISSDKEQELHKVFEENFRALSDQIKKLNFPLQKKKVDDTKPEVKKAIPCESQRKDMPPTDTKTQKETAENPSRPVLHDNREVTQLTPPPPTENTEDVITPTTMQQLRARRKWTLDSRMKNLYQTWKEKKDTRPESDQSPLSSFKTPTDDSDAKNSNVSL